MSKEYDYDCIVIGGGITGLITARNLAEKGVQVLLIEANDRLGGRIHDVYHRDDFYNYSTKQQHQGQSGPNADIETVISLGADRFDSQRHELLVKEIRRYGLHHATHREDVAKHFIRSSRLDVMPMNEYMNMLVQDPVYQSVCTRIESQAAEINPSTAFFQIDHTFLDTPLFNYLTESLGCDEKSEIMELICLQVYMLFGSELETISTVMFLQLVRQFGSLQRMFNFYLQYDYIVEGYGKLIHCIAEDILKHSGCEIRVSTPVITVTSVSTVKPVVSTYDYPDPEPTVYSTRVKLATGEELHSRSTICATPINTVLSIKWVPPLPNTIQRGSERCNINRNYFKAFAYAEGVSVRVNRILNKMSYHHAYESQLKARKLLKIKGQNRELSNLDGSLISANVNAPRGETWKRMSIVGIHSKRDEILAKQGDSILRAFKLHHPDMNLSNESLTHASNSSLLSEDHAGNVDSRVIYHDFIADRYIRSTWFNLRVGTGSLHYDFANDSSKPWGDSNNVLYIASSDLALNWTGWVEGGIEVGIRAAEMMAPIIKPPRIIRNFAKKVT